MEFIDCHTGGRKLLYNGFAYTKKRRKNRIRWECSQRKVRNCKGAVTTSLQYDDPHETAPHSHDADNAAVEATKVTARMRSRVRENPTVRPAQVLASELLSAPNDVRAALGDKEVMRRKLRRQKRGFQPLELSRLSTLNLPSEMNKHQRRLQTFCTERRDGVKSV